MRNPIYAVSAGAILALSAGNMPAHAADNDAFIKSAISAAPEGVAKDATIMIPDGKGGMMTVKKGTNGFTCMPANTPADYPMCGDENSMLWVTAFVNHAPPPPDGKVGLSYMLQGDCQASNIDPYATTPPAGGHCVKDGPHMMIFNSKAVNDAYPHEVTETPDVSQPYVMFAGSPYAHLMIPVKP